MYYAMYLRIKMRFYKGIQYSREYNPKLNTKILQEPVLNLYVYIHIYMYVYVCICMHMIYILNVI